VRERFRVHIPNHTPRLSWGIQEFNFHYFMSCGFRFAVQVSAGGTEKGNADKSTIFSTSVVASLCRQRAEFHKTTVLQTPERSRPSPDPMTAHCGWFRGSRREECGRGSKATKACAGSFDFKTCAEIDEDPEPEPEPTTTEDPLFPVQPPCAFSLYI
jgi:hypothetical protein